MMNANPLKKLGTFGQSIWLDYIQRDLITSGQLRHLIEEDGLRGITSKGVNAIYETLSQRDVQSAADEFRSVYDKTAGNE